MPKGREEEYLAAARRNMPGEEAPPEAPPTEEMPPEAPPEGVPPEAPPEEAAAVMQLTLTPQAIDELSKPENRAELMKLVEAGIVAMAEGAEEMKEAAAEMPPMAGAA